MRIGTSIVVSVAIVVGAYLLVLFVKSTDEDIRASAVFQEKRRADDLVLAKQGWRYRCGWESSLMTKPRKHGALE